MKCKTCNGLGRTKAIEFIGVDEGLREVVILCPTCGGKGEVELLTEKEYIQTCTTEQLAEMLANESKNVINDFKNFDFKREHKEFWEMWLKQPHKME